MTISTSTPFRAWESQLAEVDRALLKSLLIARAAGVTLVFGTDGGVLPHGQNADELVALKKAGLRESEIIRMATIDAAKAFGLSDSIGSVRPRMSADLIAVSGDPS